MKIPIIRVPPYSPIIRKLSKRDFMHRFTQQERIALRASNDPLVVDLYEDAMMATFIDLDLPDLRQGLNYLVSIELLRPERIDAILANG